MSSGVDSFYSKMFNLEGSASPSFPSTGAGGEMVYSTDGASGSLSGVPFGVLLFQSYSRTVTAYRDMWLKASTLLLDADALKLGSAGSTFKRIQHGTATLTGGTVTVANTSITVNSRIILTGQDNNVTGALRVSARSAGVSFTITSSAGTDSGVVAWQVIEP